MIALQGLGILPPMLVCEWNNGLHREQKNKKNNCARGSGTGKKRNTMDSCIKCFHKFPTLFWNQIYNLYIAIGQSKKDFFFKNDNEN